MALLEAKNLAQSFEGQEIISDVSIELGPNEIVCLIGTSGVGKTTLFQILSGLHQPTAGHVVLEGQDITGQAGKISYMLQKDMLLPYRTIEDNIALPLIIQGTHKKEARVRIQPYFEEFGLEGTQKKYPSQLSGGMRQRAALLRTYMFSHKVVLLDEPFSALDALTKHEMHTWYLKIMEKIQLSTLFVSHDIDEAIYLSNRVLVMAGTPGTIIKEIPIVRTMKNRDEFGVSPQFLEYKKQLLAFLR
ncbi:MAG: ABC transporter ATP-binding protein [Spirochaetaceae bacterium]|nr:ABC transporter ATP-binding protein [Spirochaetaceae bacterium]